MQQNHYDVHIPVPDEYSPYVTPPFFWQLYNAVLYYQQLGNSQSGLSCFLRYDWMNHSRPFML
jgi:hypothetical protein